jgi:hypothetical protein
MMKIFVVVLACMMAMTLGATPAYCHPPKDIAISITGENIDVVVTHLVPNPAGHYIKTIKVSLNGTVLIQQTFFLQTGNRQVARYTIPGLRKGDSVSVEADCSKFGSLVRVQKAE